MQSDQLTELAEQIVGHSLRLEENDRVLIDVVGEADELVTATLTKVYEAGAQPFLRTISTDHLKTIVRGGSEVYMKHWADVDRFQMRGISAYLRIRADENLYDWSDIPQDRFTQYVNHYRLPQQEAIAKLSKWLMIQYPTHGMAQQARMSTPAYQELYFRSSCMDYARLAEAAKPLQDLMAQVDKVRIEAVDTDFQFRIRGIPSYMCDGRYNLPDGELFTAPLAESAEGEIRFNIPSAFMGIQFEQVRFKVNKGHVIHADSSQRELLRSIIGSDFGASRFGEFGIGLNPFIRMPTNHVSMDEKMGGSIHLALGQAFEYADNGNKSAIHWDFVQCHFQEFGGGNVYFDNQLVRRDGLYVHPQLLALNGAAAD